MFYPFIDKQGRDRDALLEYLAVRSPSPQEAPFFIHEDGTALSENMVRKMLIHGVEHLSLKGLCISGHSYRIGGCTWRYKAGCSVEDLR